MKAEDVYAFSKRRRSEKPMSEDDMGAQGEESMSEDDELDGGEMAKDMACEDIMSALESKDVKALRAALDDYFGSRK